MIVIWYRDNGNRPQKTATISDHAYQADIIPSSFEVEGVIYGRRIDSSTVDTEQFGLRVDPPSDSISTDAVDSIATALETFWGGQINHVDTEVV